MELERSDRPLLPIKGLFGATTSLHDEEHASVAADEEIWFCSKNKFLSAVPSLNLLKSALDLGLQNAKPIGKIGTQFYNFFYSSDLDCNSSIK